MPREDGMKSSRFTNSQNVLLGEDLELNAPHPQQRMKLHGDPYTGPPPRSQGRVPSSQAPSYSNSLLLKVSQCEGKTILPRALVKLPRPFISPWKEQA